jgi:hypothetical protein
MNRRVIEISRFKIGQGQDQLLFRLNEPPDTYPDADSYAMLTCTSQDAEFAAINAGQLPKDVMRLAGAHLRESLYSQPAVGQAIQEAISQAKLNQGQVVPIYLHLREGTQAIEPLPWETLCDTQGQFLALDERWPIGRISGGLSAQQERERIFSPPIRVAAFLSAASIAARGEWDALYEALHKSQVPIDLRVFIAEPDLEAHINQRVQSATVSVQINYLSLPFDFGEALGDADAAPHIIHFFCHGSTVDGPSLLLATLADWEHGRSDIELGPQDFRRIRGLDQHLWLVTLNCCEGAAADQQSSSFARTLVAEFKIPAVVAMREAVKVEDANIFCRAFYTALLREIKPSLAAGAAPVTVEWARALYDPRFSICNAYAASSNTKLASAAAANKEWALPVIYVRASEFKLRAVASQPSPNEIALQSSLSVEIEQLQELLQKLPEDTPQDAIAEIKQRVASLEAQLLV